MTGEGRRRLELSNPTARAAMSKGYTKAGGRVSEWLDRYMMTPRGAWSETTEVWDGLIASITAAVPTATSLEVETAAGAMVRAAVIADRPRHVSRVGESEHNTVLDDAVAQAVEFLRTHTDQAWRPGELWEACDWPRWPTDKTAAVLAEAVRRRLAWETPHGYVWASPQCPPRGDQ